MFEIKGYSLEYYCNGKYIGSAAMAEANDRAFGYSGREYFIAQRDFYITKANKPVKVKKGTNYYTELIKICGRVK